MRLAVEDDRALVPAGLIEVGGAEIVRRGHRGEAKVDVDLVAAVGIVVGELVAALAVRGTGSGSHWGG